MGRCAELERFRVKLWDQYVTVRDFYGGIAVSFDDLWFDFLSRYFVSEQPLTLIFDQVCRDMERHVIRKTEPEIP